MSEDLEVVATVGSEAEADLVLNRLLSADIHGISQRTIGGPEFGSSGSRSVLVSAQDLDRARELLSSEEGAFSDDELARLSEEAGREANEQ